MITRELRQKRAKLIHDARAMLEAAETENRSMTAEEEHNYDEIMDDVADLAKRIERHERQMQLEAELEQSVGSGLRTEIDSDTGAVESYEFKARALRGIDVAELGRLRPLLDSRYGDDFGRFLRRGIVSPELRSLQADLDASGGYLYAPVQFVDRLIKAVDDAVFIRQWATVIAVTDGESLGVPTLEADPADADWTTELATGSEDTAMSFGRRELNPHPLAKRIKISRKLLRKAPSAENLVLSRLAYKFGITFEKALLTGSGSGQPLGVFTASADGISTSRDVSTDNTTTAMTFDGLINAKYTLKQQYWPRARWLFHRDAVKMIAKLKDSNNQYLWRESVRVGEPDRILGLPVFMSEYAPNTFTTGQYVGILGDFSQYWIADSLAFEVQRLSELYAETNQIGLIGRMESDGMPVLEEAFVRVTLA